MENKLFISCPMSGYNDDEIRNMRRKIHFLTAILINDPNIKLIDQFDVIETEHQFDGMNENQIRQTRLHRSLNYMIDANIIVFARNWWKSAGCLEEYLEYTMYMKGALCIMGSELEELEYKLYGYHYPVYDTKAESETVTRINSLAEFLKNTPNEIDLKAPVRKFLTSDVNQCNLNDDIMVYKDLQQQVEKEMTFRDFVDTFGEDGYYGGVLHSTCHDIVIDEIVRIYGHGNSKVTVSTTQNVDGQSCLTVVESVESQIKPPGSKEYEIDTSTYSIQTDIKAQKELNEEYLRATTHIKFGDRTIFTIVYLPSEISPSPSRISETVTIEYVGSTTIKNRRAKQVMSAVNKRLKTFFKDRDDIVLC